MMMLVYNSYGYTGRMAAMRHVFINLLLILLPAGMLISCKKDSVKPGSATLTIVNAVEGSKPLATNFSQDGPVPYKNGQRLSSYYEYYNAIRNFTAYSGQQRLRLFQYPDTTDKDVPLFDLSLNLPVGSMNTLFLTGTANAPDTVFTRDAIPFFPASDSTMAVRFIHLSPGSDPVSINVKGLSNGSEISSIQYKKFTEFIKYAATDNISEYEFEFRDAASGDFITSFTIDGINERGDIQPNYRLFRSYTIALVGVPGGTGNSKRAGLLVSHF